jgi:hypothetical protein
MDIGIFSLTAAVIFAVLIWYFSHTKRYAKNMMKVGISAAHSFVMNGNEDALLAAKTVKAGMSVPHGQEFFYWTTNIPTDNEDMEIQSTYKQRAKRLAEEILATKGSVDNATSLRQQLNAHKSQWLTAVTKCDPVLADKLRDEASVKSIMEDLRTT